MWPGFSFLGLGICTYGFIYTFMLCVKDCDLQLACCEMFKRKRPLRKLKGKVVFITGASSGIGEHTAYALAKYGVRLALSARRLKELERVKQHCLAVSSGLLESNDILVLQMDATDLESLPSHFDSVIAYFGGVDILLCNAGRSQRARWEQIEIVVDKQMFELNVFSVVALSRIALKHFQCRGIGGHIAVMSSMAGISGAPFSATYTASKHALHGYFNSLRAEKLGTGLTVTLLCPGPTYTNFLGQAFTEKQGQKYGIEAQKTDRRLTGERCGELCALAIANRLNESWMGLFPTIPFIYLSVYFPILTKTLMNLIGPERAHKFRDGKALTLNSVEVQ